MRTLRFALLSICCALWLAAISQAQVYTAYDGTVTFEMEGYATNIARSSRTWELFTDTPGYSGSGYMVVTNSSVSSSNITTSIETTSPELQFQVQFPVTGTYRVWARGFTTGGTDDSIHIGLDGSVSAAGQNLTWDPVTNVWHWTNTTFGSVVRTVVVSSTGLHTFSVWMREDGAKVDRIALTTSTTFKASIGNSFHIPANLEADLGVPTMRFPVGGIQATSQVQIFNGNQFQGGGNPGNQLTTGSTVFWKVSTSTVWNAQAMSFFTTGVSNPNNKYFVATFAPGTFAAGQTIQYYLRIPYSDHLPTFLYGNDTSGLETELEAIAQADPYSFTVEWPLTPSGDYNAITNVTPQGELEARIYTDSGHITLVGPDLAGTPGANTITIEPPSAQFGGEHHAIGAVLSATPTSNGLDLVQWLATTTIQSRLTFMAEGVARYEVTHWGNLPITRTKVSAPSDSNERFYGFGEKFNDFDQSGRNIRIITDDPAGDKGDKSYKVAPWFISTRGYGFHLDSSAESWFNMRASQSDRYVISNLFPSVKFNLVYGPRLTNVLERYTGYTGRPQMSPAWAYAPWISSDIWRTGGEVRYILTKYRERGLAGSVIVFDSPWETAYNDFTWNAQQFASNSTHESVNYPGFATINDMMSFIRSNGFKVICWMTPFVNTSSAQDVPGITNGYAANYAEGSNLGYFVRSSPGGSPLVSTWWKGPGSPIDFTSTNASYWLQAQLSNLVSQSGGVIGGFKTDDGESGNPPYSYIPTNASYSDGRSGVEMANAYATLYHRTVWNVLGTNGILFARSGFTGSQAYPGYWAGDNEPNFGHENGLPSVVVASQSAAMSGYSIWSHDIGGYQDCCYSSTLTNLFMRWTQFGAFSPLMQMHRQVGSGIQYPWSFGAEGLTNFHYYTRMHTALFPYIYSYAKQSSVNGMPIMRPLVLLNQEDANTHTIRHTYMFGNELLVAAIVTNVAVSRTLYLPAGAWYDIWNNTRYAGSQLITWSNANQREYPVFAREGAIIPTISSNIVTLLDPAYIGHTNLATMDDALEYLLYPGSTLSSFELYDGTTSTLISNDTVVTFTVSGAARPTSLRVLQSQPAGVERDGVRLPRFTNVASFASATLGWLWDTNGFIRTKFGHDGGTATVRMGPDTVGDGIPNSWRQHHFGSATTTNASTCATCDADGDGLSNAQEYGAGTNPADSNSVLRIQSTGLQVTGGTNNVVITWPSVTGVRYTVRFKDQATDATLWTPVATQFDGTGSTLLWYDNGTLTGFPPENSPTGQRYYRVDVLTVQP